MEPAYGSLCVMFLSSVLDFTLYPVLKGNLSFSQQYLGPFLGLKCWEVKKKKMLGSVVANSGSRYTPGGEF